MLLLSLIVVYKAKCLRSIPRIVQTIPLIRFYQTKKSDNRLQTVARLSWRLRVTLALLLSLIALYKAKCLRSIHRIVQTIPLIRLVQTKKSDNRLQTVVRQAGAYA